ncbi:FAD-dependent oxidoreductase [archaeon]|nr:FAD-dependent oxidoreductase [archaeon]MBL7057400.1 FAD-dependent oxidoreductase [Candidatus Woesearchaeota archaeon]
MNDVIIIGGGAAGMTAALYTARKNLKTMIISVDVGGQTALPSNIENYPGYDGVNGFELMMKFQAQATKWGTEMITGKVVKLEKDGDIFKLELESGDKHESKAIILAFGKTPRALNIPGEDKFMGKGVSTCVTCDGPFYKGKTVAIVGGGNSALGGARELADIAEKIYLVHRRDEFRGDPIEVDRVRQQPNVELVLSHVPKEVTGENVVTGLVVEDTKTNQEKTLKVDGVFIEAGYIVDSAFLGDLVKRNEQKEVIINQLNETSQPGIFAAGDVTNTPFKQTVISAGEGAKAALQCHNYLTGAEVGLDWKH